MNKSPLPRSTMEFKRFTGGNALFVRRPDLQARIVAICSAARELKPRGGTIIAIRSIAVGNDEVICRGQVRSS
jgi:hypothetical protein